VTSRLSRAQLFSRGAKGGAALVVAGSVAELFAGTAAADSIPDADLAYARLLIGVELLASDFYARALAAKRFGKDESTYLKRVHANEQEHYRMLSGILSGAGQTPALPADFDFSYPKRTFSAKASIARLGVRLETAFLGAYLGAVDGLQTNSLKQPMARIAASEAEHLSLFRRLSGGDPVGVAFPSSLTIEQASAVLDSFSS
jgi:rubrerythrin